MKNKLYGVYIWIKYLINSDLKYDDKGKITDEVKQDAVDLRRAGFTYNEIGKRLGLNKTSVWRIINR